jgi:ETFB lysine methyltransferase
LSNCRFKYKEISFDIGGTTVMLKEVTNFDELFNLLVIEQGNSQISLDDFIPYWTELWPSAKGLSNFIAENWHIIKDKNIIEIGCGLGLPSLISAKLGAQKVVATDLIEDALDHVILNASLNGVSELVEVKIVDWTKMEVSDWSSFDVILAADIIYEKRFVEEFINFISKIISSHQEKLVIIAEPQRQVAATMIEVLKKNDNLKIETSSIEVESRGTIFNILVHCIIIGGK